MTDRPFSLRLGDCLATLRAMPANSVDAIVTDPPYGLTANKKGGTGTASVNLESPYGRARIGTGNGPGGFMGHKWDSDVPSVEIWAECLRVLKPGGHLLAFAGTRTQHRMAVRIEDAGFEIRDLIAWVYGSGFPKSHNGEWGGTALKPALEPITVARKPLVGTVEANWREHGTGALNIDGCRVGGEVGRWPANLIHDGSEEVLLAFPFAPGQQGPIKFDADERKTGNVYGAMKRGHEPSANSDNEGAVGFKMKPGMRRLDEGSAARFFYCAKASRADRNEGIGGSAAPAVTAGATMGDRERADWQARNGNHHPTVKPTDLMRYLVRLVTPPGGLVLDPFMGSGSTGKAAMLEGFRFVGCELSPEYLAIAEARIGAALQAQLAEQAMASAQLDLFAA